MADDPTSADTFGHELYQQVTKESRLAEEAELETWYQDYHHWNHCDWNDRSSAHGSDCRQNPDSFWFTGSVPFI
jgi:hypothetical protein